MLNLSKIKEIRKFLEKAKKPLFFFDDDPDGLTSFLLLRKHYKKGVGICVKASPRSDIVYEKSVSNHQPDLVVVLDRPTLSQEVIDAIHVPIVWLDHHEPVERNGVHYYNSMLGKKPDNRPTSYWAYKIVKENEWLAIVGIIGDWNVPEKGILRKFKYKDLIKGAKTPPEFLFDTDYGKLVKAFAFTMKGTTDSTNKCISALLQIESPLEILEQTNGHGKLIYQKFEKMNKEYDELLNEALKEKEKGGVFVFTYSGGRNSYTGGISNELLHKLKNGIIIVGREKDGEMRMSLRSRKANMRKILKKSLENVEGYGGGHEKACGASVKIHDFSKFIRAIKKEYGKNK
jgi:single-stranded DNA-specific DHH superfamily exonuclease